MNVDTTSLRALAPSRLGWVAITEAERDALCDGYDEAARLRSEVKAVTASYKQQKHSAMVARDRDEKRARQRDNAVERGDRMKAQRDAARQALADLIGELRGLLADEWRDEPPSVNYPDGRRLYRWPASVRDDLRAVIDRHDPDLFQCVHCEQYRDVEDGTDSVAGMGCHDCAGRP